MTQPSQTNPAEVNTYDAIVVGAGAAGIGVAIALKDAGLENYLVLEGDRVGASFDNWPAETRFITPSFPTNSVGMVDINAIAIGISPAYALDTEHPTGSQYAAHLREVAAFFKVPVQEQTPVLRVTPVGDEFRVDTDEDTLRAKHVIWAAGEFMYPRLNGFAGSELCTHTATLASYDALEGDDFLVVGGYESGIDAAYHLAQRGKRVRLFDMGSPWDAQTSDPSTALSTYSMERMRDEHFKANVELFPNTPVMHVSRSEGKQVLYQLKTLDEELFESPVPPLLASGFVGSHRLVSHLFEDREDGYPLLSENDESTITPGLFLCGAAVRHGNHVFCFIYKYRQRFAVVAKAIATSLGLPAERLESYRSWGMYLDDLSCCGEECVC
ncbi:MAG: NAD(P)/FAD-dependent oxidoreductase [Planctomycetota bacterium]